VRGREREREGTDGDTAIPRWIPGVCDTLDKLWTSLRKSCGCRHKLCSRDNAIARLTFIIIDYKCPIIIIRLTRACGATVIGGAARAFLSLFFPSSLF